MAFSIYESISNNQTIPVNIFVVPIQSSTFHWHNEYEMIGVLKGKIVIRVESELVTMNEGDVFLINPNVIHSIREYEDQKNLCMVIQMSRELFMIDESATAETRFYLDSTGEEIPECGFEYFFKKMAELVYESMSENKHKQLRIRAQICTLIADLFDQVVYDVRFGDIATRSDQELTVALIAFLEQHLEEEKIVDITCREFGLSRRSLDRNLKITLGLTGKEIIENLRVEKAKNLLKNTNKNMNYILDVCGFGSEKTFYRVFREETGVTPNVFRKKGQIDHYDEALKGYLDYETAEVKRLLCAILEQS